MHTEYNLDCLLIDMIKKFFTTSFLLNIICKHEHLTLYYHVWLAKSCAFVMHTWLSSVQKISVCKITYNLLLHFSSSHSKDRVNQCIFSFDFLFKGSVPFSFLLLKKMTPDVPNSLLFSLPPARCSKIEDDNIYGRRH